MTSAMKTSFDEEDLAEFLNSPGPMDEHEAAMIIQKAARGKMTRAETKARLKKKGTTKVKAPPPALGIFQPEGSSIGLVLDGQSHPVNNTGGTASIAQLSFGRSARVVYSVS